MNIIIQLISILHKESEMRKLLETLVVRFRNKTDKTKEPKDVDFLKLEIIGGNACVYHNKKNLNKAIFHQFTVN